jgi:proteasome activator subunit 4
MGIPNTTVSEIMDLMLSCLSDDNVEVREMASSALSGIVRVSQRQSIIPLKVMPDRAMFSHTILMLGLRITL